MSWSPDKKWWREKATTLNGVTFVTLKSTHEANFFVSTLLDPGAEDPFIGVETRKVGIRARIGTLNLLASMTGEPSDRWSDVAFVFRVEKLKKATLKTGFLAFTEPGEIERAKTAVSAYAGMNLYEE